MRTFVTCILLLLGVISTKGQELNCNVQILSPQLNATDQNLFRNLEIAIMEFMNNRKWTKDIFQNNERIECSFLITVSEQVSASEFKGKIQVQASRPVYGSSYSTPLINFNDDDFQFTYVESQQLEFNENAFFNNLTSVLGYYAYIILGLDYDSFAQNGGTPYFKLAQKIVTNAQSAGEAGWKSFQSDKNRYWLVDNYLDKPFIPLRNVHYKYHRLGMDKLVENTDEGRKTIIACLKELQTLHNTRPLSFNMRVFFNAKSDEVINLFSEAPSGEKNQALQILGQIDPGNLNRYQKINSSN